VRVRHFRWSLRRTKIAAVVLALVAAPLAAAAAVAPHASAATSCPWVNSTAPIPTRVSELMGQMSLSQEIAMMTGVSGSSYVGNIPAISSLCIPAMNLEDGPAGVGDGMSNVTQLPAPVDVAATWDTAAEQEYGHVIGAEQAAKGSTVDLGPTINIVRDPRWGRAFESIGEDPFLAGQLAAAGRGEHQGAGLGDGVDAAHGDVGAGEQPPDLVGVLGPVQRHPARSDRRVAAAGVDVRVDARQPEGLAGAGEDGRALGYEVLDALAGGGGVVEDLHREAVRRQRGGRPLQALRLCRVGERGG